MGNSKVGMGLIRTVAAIVSVVMAVLPAAAHPHVSISIRTNLMIDNGALVGLHHIWVMDEGWLASQLEQHDKDGDGRLSQAELEPLVSESKATLEMFKSFTTLRHGGQRIRPLAPQHLSIDYYGDRLGLSFVVPMPKPLPLAGADLLLEVYDATYFSGFSFAGADAIGFAGSTAGCSINTSAAPSPQQASAYKMVSRQLGPEFNAKAATLQAAGISCPKGHVGAGDAVGLHVPVSVR